MEKVGGRKALTVAMAPHSMNAWDFQTSGHPSLIQDLLQTSPGAHPSPETALTSYCSSQPLLVQENNTSKNSIACNITTPQHHPNFFFSFHLSFSQKRDATGLPDFKFLEAAHLTDQPTQLNTSFSVCRKSNMYQKFVKPLSKNSGV